MSARQNGQLAHIPNHMIRYCDTVSHGRLHYTDHDEEGPSKRVQKTKTKKQVEMTTRLDTTLENENTTGSHKAFMLCSTRGVKRISVQGLHAAWFISSGPDD